MWKTVRLTLPAQKRRTVAQGKLLILRDEEIDARHKRTLERGPKFCLQPDVSPVDLLATSRNIARHVPEDEKSRFLIEATDVIAARKREQRPQYRLKPVCDYPVDNQLRLLVSDKEGFFVVVPNGIFNEKASAAIAKTFKKVKAKPSSYRKKAIAWLDDHNLRSLSSRVKVASEVHLDVFFTAKTH
ncbi:hypothetical protein V5799_007120 [Amblyomma americanum]|uniref:Uncharacterized protein n=1 Tax=Amblyomma americanum TaxID=6943 RepID=A0AAQ4DUF9_AMBAM